jgi:putative SOS response-associated peptidase YedK
MLAGLWSEWTDPQTGELVPNFTMITCNCDTHPLLGRLHKPDPNLPADKQDKRSLIHLEPERWEQWLHGSEDDARALIRPAQEAMFDRGDVVKTDALLAAGGPNGSLF